MSRKNNSCLFIITVCAACIIVFNNCKQASQRPFFTGMSEPCTIKIDSKLFLIKDFFVEEKAIDIQHKAAWKLDCDEHSLFFLRGYLSYKDSCIRLLYLDSKKTSILKEQKLFDLNAGVSETWDVFFESNKNDNIRGDSIVYRGKYKKNGELLYAYSIFNFELVPEKTKKIFSSLISFRIEVNGKKGIRNIEVYDFSQKNLLYVASLYPAMQLIDTGRGSYVL